MNKVRRAVYPGSFDPITFGHIDIVRRALELFDEIIVAVASNGNKTPFFTKEERMEMAREAVAEFDVGDRLKVVSFQGLLVNFAKEQGAVALVRGLRAISDFEYEMQIALTNRKLEPGIETVFLMPKENFIYLSSNIVKELARLKAPIHSFVPQNVERMFEKKYENCH